eukprot:748527-Rhodomonas_salina.3
MFQERPRNYSQESSFSVQCARRLGWISRRRLEGEILLSVVRFRFLNAHDSAAPLAAAVQIDELLNALARTLHAADKNQPLAVSLHPEQNSSRPGAVGERPQHFRVGEQNQHRSELLESGALHRYFHRPSRARTERFLVGSCS